VTSDKLNIGAAQDAGVNLGTVITEGGGIHGIYNCACYDENGDLVWEDAAPNVVTTVGQNQLLAAALQGSAYTVTGPYMGLISATSFTATAASDTMGSHSGWVEDTNCAARNLAAFGTPSAGAITLSAVSNFVMTATDTVEGLFVVFGSGASSVISNAGGVLLSAAAFSSGSKAVQSGYTIQASYTLTL
jgi:hypothetical protein